jgi:hypothetical protein
VQGETFQSCCEATGPDERLTSQLPGRIWLREAQPDNVIAAIARCGDRRARSVWAIHSRPGSDAGFRTCRLNLWRPGHAIDDGPALTYAPAAWWLVGLGHLGQACAWLIAWPEYREPSRFRTAD